jgi:hypothetical protein
MAIASARIAIDADVFMRVSPVGAASPMRTRAARGNHFLRISCKASFILNSTIMISQ